MRVDLHSKADHSENLRLGQAWAAGRAAGELEGLFGPGSQLWRISREMALMAAGGRALVLQLAHPAVAEGVNQNSHFRQNLIQRARRTFAQLFTVFFDTRTKAMQAGQRTHQMHRRVQGRITAETHPAQEGRLYQANDPEYLRWVWATLIDSSVMIYELLIEPLESSAIQAYYDEYRLVGAVMGIPPEVMPSDWPAFRTYFDDMVAGDELHVGQTTRMLCHDLFNSPLTMGRFDETITLGLLPPNLREAVGYPWNRRTRAGYAAMVRVLRSTMSRLPPALRYAPAYNQALIRIAHARGETPPLRSRVIHRIDQYVDIPFSLN
jgi:uncharacterized protein (DUF2236 family)